MFSGEVRITAPQARRLLEAALNKMHARDERGHAYRPMHEAFVKKQTPVFQGN